MNSNQEYNQLVRQEVEAKLGKSLREIDWIRLSKMFKCTFDNCKEFLPMPILNFYGYNVQTVLCYKHQEHVQKNHTMNYA